MSHGTRRRFFSFPPGQLLLLFLTLNLAGCGAKTVVTPTARQDPAEQIRIVRSLPVAGNWGETTGAGLRARLLLSDTEVKETEAVRASLVIENSGKSPAALRFPGVSALTGHQLLWQAGEVEARTDRVVVSNELTQTTLQLAPGESFVTEPVNVIIPPGEGSRPLRAALPIGTERLTAAAIPLNVLSAEWGPVTDGLRIRLGASSATYPVGTAPVLNLYVHNVAHERVRIRPVEWRSLDINARGDKLIFSAKSIQEQAVEVPKGQFWMSPVPDVPLFAPGAYIASFLLTSQESAAASGTAWHGKLTSNDVRFEIKGR